ncbi:MAG TPA: hypothetical protein ENH87_19445 [Pricia antarctica]|uniref:Uncharacterized protein n=1 Tax=Pricia antarctica TaxID=641691 RepID=A0A831VSR0_9FLAO|nr:hypothetical protein [Pricia antarctica]
MKTIAVILSLYFLALNFIPCNDGDMLSNESNIESIIATGGNHDHGATDLCSPFCNCHCCHVHTIESSIVAFEPIITMNFKKSFSHFDSLGKDNSRYFLQPPRA